mgnify:CR=1 FL=1
MVLLVRLQSTNADLAECNAGSVNTKGFLRPVNSYNRSLYSQEGFFGSEGITSVFSNDTRGASTVFSFWTGAFLAAGFLAVAMI